MEIKVNEKSVGVVPNILSELVNAGHNILVRQGPSADIAASDSDYFAIIAEIIPDASSIFSNADMLAKVGEFKQSEYFQLTSD